MFDLMSQFCVLLHERVFSEKTCGGQEEMNQKLWRYRLIPARCRALPEWCRDESVAKCGDPQGYITNGCRFRQCKSGKNRLNCSEEDAQLACVSVHCKLTTRATHFDAYSGSGIERIKGNLFSENLLFSGGF